MLAPGAAAVLLAAAEDIGCLLAVTVRKRRRAGAGLASPCVRVCRAESSGLRPFPVPSMCVFVVCARVCILFTANKLNDCQQSISGYDCW